MKEFTWQERTIYAFDKPVQQPRLMAWSGHVWYGYSGNWMEPRPFSEALRELTEKVGEFVGYPHFNHVVLNLYRTGECVTRLFLLVGLFLLPK